MDRFLSPSLRPILEWAGTCEDHTLHGLVLLCMCEAITLAEIVSVVKFASLYHDGSLHMRLAAAVTLLVVTIIETEYYVTLY